MSHSRVNRTCETNKHDMNKQVSNQIKTKRMLKTRLQLPRNQGVSLNPRQRRHFDECKSVVSDIKMRVVVPTGIDGSRSRGSVCSGALASVERREMQRE